MLRTLAELINAADCRLLLVVRLTVADHLDRLSGWCNRSARFPVSVPEGERMSQNQMCIRIARGIEVYSAILRRNEHRIAISVQCGVDLGDA